MHALAARLYIGSLMHVAGLKLVKAFRRRETEEAEKIKLKNIARFRSEAR